MYNIIVIVHNLLRWIVLILGFITTTRTFIGWIRNIKSLELDRKLSFLFTISLDLQLFIGLVLFLVYSNWGLKAILDQGFSSVMRQDVYRFFAIEHGFFMVISLVFAHLGYSNLKKVDESRKNLKRASIYFCLSLVLILVGIPWFRPLFPSL